MHRNTHTAATAVQRVIGRENESFARELKSWQKCRFYKSGEPKPRPVSWDEQRDSSMATFCAIRDRERLRFKDDFETVTESHVEFLRDVIRFTGRRAIDIALAMVRYEIYSPEFDPTLIAAAVEIDEAAKEVAACN